MRTLTGRVEAATRRGGRGGGRPDDRRSPGGDRVPSGTEEEGAFALCLARLLVEFVGVERMPVIRHLEGAVASLRRSEQRGFYTGAGGRLPVSEQGRPEGRTDRKSGV